MPSVVEIMARGIVGARIAYNRRVMSDDKRLDAMSLEGLQAQAALSALQDAGFVVVPVEPTPEMLKRFTGSHALVKKIYTVMITASTDVGEE